MATDKQKSMLNLVNSLPSHFSPVPPDAVTVRMVADELNISQSASRIRLNKLVTMGKLKADKSIRPTLYREV